MNDVIGPTDEEVNEAAIHYVQLMKAHILNSADKRTAATNMVAGLMATVTAFASGDVELTIGFAKALEQCALPAVTMARIRVKEKYGTDI